MAKVTLSQASFESLLKQLVEIEEGKRELLEKYFLEPSVERHELEELVEKYTKHIDQLIRKAKKSQNSDNSLPFVTINSEVEVLDLSFQEIFKYRIVNPFQSNIREGDVSYLSPVGKSLLLKKVGDQIEVKAPGGVFRYEIKSIQLLPQSERKSEDTAEHE